MTLVRLACPRCGGELPAPPGAVLLPCAACGSVAEAAAGRLREVPSRVIAPKRDAGGRTVVHLPCWTFALSWQGAELPPDLPARVVMPAVAPTHGGALLRLARGLGRAAADWEAAAAGGAPAGALAGRLGAADGAALAETAALASVPGAVREGLLKHEPFPLRVEPAGLSWVPCAQAGGRCEDLVSGTEVPARLLDPAAAAAAAPPAATAPGAETPAPRPAPALLVR